METLSSPLVSMVVISMNHARYIPFCMKSILEQEYENLEILYLDNDSHDSSYDVAMSFLEGNPKLIYCIKQTTKEGVCKNVNHLLARAKGEYCAFISADDFMLPGRIANQVEIIKRLPKEYGVIFSDALLVDENNTYLPQTFLKRLGREAPDTETVYEALLEGNFIPGMATLVRRLLIAEVGGYNENLIYEDYDMWLKLAQKTKFFFMEEPQVVYRITPNSLEKTMGEKGLTDKIDIYYNQLVNKEYRSLILEKIGIYTNDLYNYNYSSFRAYAKKYLALRFNWKTTIFFTLSLLHIPLFKVKK